MPFLASLLYIFLMNGGVRGVQTENRGDSLLGEYGGLQRRCSIPWNETEPMKKRVCFVAKVEEGRFNMSELSEGYRRGGGG